MWGEKASEQPLHLPPLVSGREIGGDTGDMGRYLPQRASLGLGQGEVHEGAAGEADGGEGAEGAPLAEGGEERIERRVDQGSSEEGEECEHARGRLCRRGRGGEGGDARVIPL